MASKQSEDSKKETIVLVEEDIPGAALPYDSVEACSVVQLKRWLTCRGAKILDWQREILVRHYNDGMTSKGAAYAKKIQAASTEANLEVDKVKKWIGNETQRRAKAQKIAAVDPNPEASTGVVGNKRKFPGFLKGPSKFNVFCSEYFKSDECSGMDMGTKNFLASKIWKSMKSEEKEQYSKKARELRNPDLDSISQEHKQQLIKEHKKQLMAEVHYLEDLGCELAATLLEPSGEVFTLGSSAGLGFLCSNGEVVLKFKEYFGNHDI